MIIVVSATGDVNSEVSLINALFEEGLEIFHLRKPGIEIDKLVKLLDGIKKEHCEKIALHQHHELAAGFGIYRLHFNSQSRSAAKGFQTKGKHIFSTSIHQLKEVEQVDAFDYTFFGPVFDSISKPGYLKMDQVNITEGKKTYPLKIIGIGGVTDKNVQSLKEKGFDGAAVLGYIWQKPEHAIVNFRNLKTKWN